MAKRKEKTLTRADVLRLIEENGGTAKGLDLSEQTFVEAIDLSNLDLHGIILKDARFPVHFDRGKLVGANLYHTHLEGAILWHAHLERANLCDAHLEEANLRGAHLETADLSDTHLEGADLTGAHLEGACLTGVRLSSDTKLHNVDWGNYILAEERHGPLDWAEDTYRTLKVWYTNAGMYDIAGKFFYREKEANRKRLKLLSKDWHHRIASELIRAIFGYGERWWNIVFSIEALILLFAFTYLAIATAPEIMLFGWVLGLTVWFVYLKFATGLDWTWWKKTPVWAAGMGFLFCAFYFPAGLVTSRYIFWRYLYFSTVSFTALGYGEWAKLSDGLASDFIKGIGAFESLVGISMMALLLVTFFRKWTR